MFLLIMWRSNAVDPAPRLQLPGDGLHPKAPATRGLPGGQDNPFHLPGTGTKGLIGSVTERDRTTLAASAKAVLRASVGSALD
jgi:hypothetical protein